MKETLLNIWVFGTGCVWLGLIARALIFSPKKEAAEEALFSGFFGIGLAWLWPVFAAGWLLISLGNLIRVLRR